MKAEYEHVKKLPRGRGEDASEVQQFAFFKAHKVSFQKKLGETKVSGAGVYSRNVKMCIYPNGRVEESPGTVCANVCSKAACQTFQQVLL